MTLRLLAILLSIQGAQAPPPIPVRGTIAGVVVHGATGDPVANVRVTLARTDVPPAAAALLRQMAASDPEGGPPMEVMLPAEFLETMKAEMAQMQRDVAEKKLPDDDVPSELGLLEALPFDTIYSIIVDPRGKLATIPKNAPPIATDGAGRFEFHDLDPGTYRLIFAANGFVRQDYGQRGASGGTPLLVEAGKANEGLTMRLTPTGAISGHVRDGYGQPVAGVTVQLSRSSYDATGRKKVRPVLSARTNNRGEYRFYFLSPGRYYLSAGTAATDRTDSNSYEMVFSNVSGASTSPNRIVDQRYALTYYPGTADVNAAGPIDVGTGSDTGDINLTLIAQGLYTVRGRIIDPRAGGPPQQTSIRLTTPDGASNPNMLRSGPNYNAADGSFELRDVASGSYLLAVDLVNRQPAPPQPQGLSEAEQKAFYEAMEASMAALQANQQRALVPITVGNSDVEGVIVTPVAGSALSGRVHVETAPPGRATPLQRVVIEFRALASDGAMAPRYGAIQPPPQQVKSDGTFRITGVFPGEYWLRARGLPPGFYIKSARLGDADAQNRPMTLPVSEANTTLEIVISPNFGAIEGLASPVDGRAAAGVQVVLIPDRNRDRAELFRPVNADGAGHFSIPEVEPGDYHLAAWQLMEPYAFFDPDLIAQAQEKGAALHVDELSKQTVTIEVFPAPEAP